VPSIVFTKGGGLWLESIADIGCDAIGLDWTIDIGEARRRVGHQVALQGNLDPGVLFASPETVAAEARKVLDSYGSYNTGMSSIWARDFPVYATRKRDGAG
jgi:uroporphyrinogen decarboxylase